ncbi:thioesterase II family protein [Pseudoduganella buxea]|uniref:Alpha/beta fold hydrolase n=1 Tax=Pseudoduganella buxea TaxID=1949069 RepID=A0A6I3T4V6_9BURK|nr:alpha/beta fold hydrolase [Pseudoduganella buxea]MTV55756.1 alpha/beta fold hydrolase [Pseudoduganella buxea]
MPALNRPAPAKAGVLRRLAAPQQAQARLICFPCAGAAASFYLPWRGLLGDRIALWAVQPPGREDRVAAGPVHCWESLTGEVVDAIRAMDDGLPTFLLGHSMGALLAFEVAHALARDARTAPLHLFVSGHSAPELRNERATHLLPDAELVEVLRRYEGTDPALFANRELLELFLPVIRADLALDAAYRCAPRRPLAVPFTAFAGADDFVAPPASVQGWRRHTSDRFALRVFPGGHFFIRNQLGPIADAVATHIHGALALRSNATVTH